MVSTVTRAPRQTGLDPITSGQRMQDIRLLRHLTREQLSSLFEESGSSISVNTIRAWEQGQKTPRLPNLVRLAGLLACRLSDVAVSHHQVHSGLKELCAEDLWDETLTFAEIDREETGRSLRHRRMMQREPLTLDALSQAFRDNGFPVTSAAICGWERGIKNPSVEHAVFLADYFGCPLDELVVRCDRSRESEEHDQQVPLLFILAIAQRVHASACALFLIPVVNNLNQWVVRISCSTSYTVSIPRENTQNDNYT